MPTLLMAHCDIWSGDAHKTGRRRERKARKQTHFFVWMHGSDEKALEVRFMVSAIIQQSGYFDPLSSGH